MISLKDIKDWLKQFDIAEHYYMGKLDNKQDKSVGYIREEHLISQECV